MKYGQSDNFIKKHQRGHMKVENKILKDKRDVSFYYL